MLISDYQQHALNQFTDFLTGQNKSSITLRLYKTDLTSFFDWLGSSIKFPEITEKHIRGYIKFSLEGSEDPPRPRHEPATCNRRLATLRRFFDFLKYTETIKIDPTKPVPQLQVKRKMPDFLSQEQASRLLYYAKRESLFDYAIIHTLYYAALRANELCILERNAVDFADNRILIHGKRQRDRYVPMLPEDMKPLSAFAKACHRFFTFDRFFCNHEYRPLTQQYIHSRVSKIAASANLRCYPHMLRHSRATHLLQAGLDLYYIKTILGHSTIQTTEIYAHVDDPHLRDAFQRASHQLRVVV